MTWLGASTPGAGVVVPSDVVADMDRVNAEAAMIANDASPRVDFNWDMYDVPHYLRAIARSLHEGLVTWGRDLSVGLDPIGEKGNPWFQWRREGGYDLSLGPLVVAMQGIGRIVNATQDSPQSPFWSAP